MRDEKAFLTLEEVAGLLGVTYQLIYRQVRSGKLPAARIGRVYRVAREDLEAYIARSKATDDGVVCAACGKTFHSRHSVSQVCSVTDCDQPICFDCWTRKGVRVCAEHQANHKK